MIKKRSLRYAGIVLLLLCSATMRTTAQVTPAKVADEGKIYTKVEVEAHFDGGDKAWIQYLQENLRASVPVKKGAPAGTYTVVVKFVVNTDGRVDSVMAETDHGYGMEKEVIRIIKKAPKWIPAQADGIPVRAYRRQPVTFLLEKA
jgi:protein TonB